MDNYTIQKEFGAVGVGQAFQVLKWRDAGDYSVFVKIEEVVGESEFGGPAPVNAYLSVLAWIGKYFKPDVIVVTAE